MIQQINLYKDVLQQQQQKSLLVQVPLLLLSLFVLLLLFSVYTKWHTYKLQQTLTLNEQRLKEDEAKVNSLLARIPAQALDPNLATEVQRLQHTLDDLAQTIQILNIKNPDNSLGFSQYLQAFANQGLKEVWLTHILITGQPKTITIDGSSSNLEKIPYFIQKFRNEPIFKGQSFAQLKIEKANDSKQINFSLSSKLLPPEDTKHVN